ncbi:MAG: oxidoreductase [Agrobacterium sp. SCN 61-19]|nr:MAG: oxidoreductase [Agrobacterium sp. SCN 61-19]
MAKGWLRALQSASDLSREVEIVGLVDLDLTTAKALAAEFALDDAIIGTNLASVIQATRANMVFDVVVPSARFNVVSTALNLGCHVLSEKPLATSMDEAKALLALAAETGRVHAVVQNRRFISGVRRLRRAVEDGLIGELSGIHCDFFLGPHFGGFREEMDNVLLLDMAIHTFDAARFVSGKQPLSVYCVESNPSGSWYAHGASANAIFKLSGDAVFTYRGSWCAEGRRTSWESAWKLVGSKGMITWDGEESFEATVAGNEPGLLRGQQVVPVPSAPNEDETHGHQSVLAEFIDAVKSGRKPETVSDDNIKSLSMVLGAIESARTGLPVSISVEGH